MKISVLKHVHLTTIPSASAVEVVNGNIYIVGDDSNFLYVLKYDLSLLAEVPLYQAKPEDIEGNRIAKHKKADLECITKLTINGYAHLLILGSGAESPRRDVAFLVKLPTPYNKKHLVWEVSLVKWYSFLRMNDAVTGPSGVLNFEAAASTDAHLYIFNRENNATLRFDMPEFIEFIQGHTDGIPFPTVIQSELPEIKGVRAGISGADYFDNTFFFTAAAEDTPNAIDDGEIMGSAIGILTFEGEEKARGKITDGFMGTVSNFTLIPEIENRALKVESVSVYEKENDTTYIAIAVSDDDKGGSDILMLQLEV
ncbi:hypothetical protein [uncultured Cytophaga sp.]|uniref:DUF6929 family protein n=1 Tax=uncultured Cytophaga sp. TaxID=160238 RepID=UPI0026246B70|nr:hypothetical protein [uncultured Cytophaga sp.]